MICLFEVVLVVKFLVLFLGKSYMYKGNVMILKKKKKTILANFIGIFIFENATFKIVLPYYFYLTIVFTY